MLAWETCCLLSASMNNICCAGLQSLCTNSGGISAAWAVLTLLALLQQWIHRSASAVDGADNLFCTRLRTRHGVCRLLQALESLVATWQPISSGSRPSAAGLAPEVQPIGLASGAQPQQAWSQSGSEAAKPALGSHSQAPTHLPAPAATAQPQHPTSLPALCLSAENSVSSEGEESTAPAESMLFAGLLASAGPAAAAEHAPEAGLKQARPRSPPAELQSGSVVAEHPSQPEAEPARAAETPSGWPAGSNGPAVPDGAQSQRWTRQEELQSLGHKHLAWRLGAASEEPSLIAEALSASSTGASAKSAPTSPKAWGLAEHGTSHDAVHTAWHACPRARLVCQAGRITVIDLPCTQ